MHKKIFYKLLFLLNYIYLMQNLYANNYIFENFDQETSKSWTFISDQVMGGVSFGKYNHINENNNSYIRLSGFVSLENNGGFIQVKKETAGKEEKLQKGIKVRLRGNNQYYFIHLRTKFTLLPWQYYQSKMFASEKWNLSDLKLSTFKRSGFMLPKKINPRYITSLAIVAYGREHRVNVDVDEIIFY